MKLSEFKSHLSDLPKLNFLLPNGDSIPSHFHITEAGLVTKHFIDCGKTIHLKKTAVFQIWTAKDIWHRLEPKTLIEIINKTELVFQGEDPEVEIEYQMETIGKFGLNYQYGSFILTRKETECLAADICGIPRQVTEARISETGPETSELCKLGSGCC